MKTLYAGPWVGEFGWELFCWQGYLRKAARKYAQCVVACREGHEVLYEDFAQVVPVHIKCEEADMWDCRGYRDHTFMQLFDRSQGKNDWIKPRQPIVRYDHEHKQDRKLLFARFKEQDFVTYGQPHGYGYDILIHARAKTNNVNAGISSKVRNWPVEKWKQFVSRFEGYNIACIGTESGALYVGGDDLRGVSLKSLCNTLASSRVVVGPSSGPIHLAALCECPQVTWYGAPYNDKNDKRYRSDWNPFRTPVEVMRYEKWDAPVKEVVDRTKKMLTS